MRTFFRQLKIYREAEFWPTPLFAAIENDPSLSPYQQTLLIEIIGGHKTADQVVEEFYLNYRESDGFLRDLHPEE